MLRILLEDGSFVQAIGLHVEVVSPTHVVGNGWDCSILEDGSILCQAVGDYPDGQHSMRCLIKPNGFARHTLKTPDGNVQTIQRDVVLPKGAKLRDGVICLSHGRIDNRRCFFRLNEFGDLLKKFGISTIERENPNRSFESLSAHTPQVNAYQEVISDGRVSWYYQDEPQTEGRYSGTSFWSGTVTHDVSGATWAIVKTYVERGNIHIHSRTLYTRIQNPKVLEASLSSVLG